MAHVVNHIHDITIIVILLKASLLTTTMYVSITAGLVETLENVKPLVNTILVAIRETKSPVVNRGGVRR